MANAQRISNYMDRANELGTRAGNMLELTDRLQKEKAHPNAAKAHFAAQHAVAHLHDVFGHGCVSASDRDHYLGLAEICLDHAEELLNQQE